MQGELLRGHRSIRCTKIVGLMTKLFVWGDLMASALISLNLFSQSAISATEPELCSMKGKDIQGRWRSICINYYWLKRTLWEVKFHAAVCSFRFADIKENGALNPFGTHNSFNVGQESWIKGPLCHFPRMGAVLTQQATCGSHVASYPHSGAGDSERSNLLSNINKDQYCML